MSMIYFSAQTNGFYDSAIHGPAAIPADAVEISRVEHRALLSAQDDGMVIVADQNGVPTVVEPKSLLDLAGLKERAWQAVKHLRDQRIDGGCTVPDIGRFDTDGTSRANINGAVTGALLAKSADRAFSINWKLEDNSLIQLDADQMLLVGETVLGHVSACHSSSQALSLAIQAASSKEELEGIDIEQGWPS